LTIRREGEEELFDVVITRAQITIPSVQSEMLENDIGYIQLFTFGAQTTPDFQNQIAELLDQGARGLILDLRNNGGGYLSTSVEIASEFIADGLILTERYGDGNEDPHYALSGGQATDIPLIVIVNGGTASASEIVAGAIQDHDRALLIGETTFGKGSVQNWVPLEDEQGAVRVTIARWYTPNDRQIHEVGLEPDVEVLITEEDIEAESDPQLDTAIELLEEQIGN
jgi:carboxyl-terminal processing protease